MNPLAGGASGLRRERTAALRSALDARPDVVLSVDVFDTVLLRDDSTETARFAEAAERAAPRLGNPPAALVDLRWLAHDAAYRAVVMTDPRGEARIADMWRACALAAGGTEEVVPELVAGEVAVDARHLSPDDEVVELLTRERAAGRRVVATSDTYYSADDLVALFTAVVGEVPFDAVYASSDLGATKHRGSIFAEVAAREGRAARDFLHCGDSYAADVAQPRAAGWRAVHLPARHRPRPARWGRRVGEAPLRWRRVAG